MSLGSGPALCKHSNNNTTLVHFAAAHDRHAAPQDLRERLAQKELADAKVVLTRHKLQSSVRKDKERSRLEGASADVSFAGVMVGPHAHMTRR